MNFVETTQDQIPLWNGSPGDCIQGLVAYLDEHDPDHPFWVIRMGEELIGVRADRVNLYSYLGYVVRIDAGDELFTINRA